MIGILIRTEIRERLSSSIFFTTLAVCSVLMVGSAISGVERYRSQLQQASDVISSNRIALQEAGSWHGVEESGLGIKLVRPVTPLVVISSGFENAVGRVVTIRESDLPRMEDSLYSTLPVFAVFGELDMLFVAKILLSLFAILYSYNVVSGARESGVLKLMFSYSMSRNTYLLGRAIGSYVSLASAFTLAFILALVSAYFLYGSHGAEMDLLRTFMFYGLMHLYALAFFTVGLLSTVLTRQSDLSFLVCLFSWVFLVLVYPAASVFIAGRVEEVPEFSQVQNEIISAREQYNKRVVEEVEEEMRSRGYSELEHPERGEKRREVRARIEEELSPEVERQTETILSDFEKSRDNMTDLAISLSSLSPASSFTFGAHDALATSFRDLRRYIEDVSAYRPAVTELISMLHTLEHSQGTSEEEIRFDLNRIPVFTPEPAALEDSLGPIMMYASTLIVFSIVLYVIAFSVFLRYDVR